MNPILDHEVNHGLVTVASLAIVFPDFEWFAFTANVALSQPTKSKKRRSNIRAAYLKGIIIIIAQIKKLNSLRMSLGAVLSNADMQEHKCIRTGIP